MKRAMWDGSHPSPFCSLAPKSEPTPPLTRHPSKEGMSSTPLLGGVARRAGVGSFLHQTLASGEARAQPVNNHFHCRGASAVIRL